MGLFKSDPQKQAQAALAEATAKRDDLEARLRLAEARVIECGNAVASLARDAAPDEKLDTAEAALIAAEKRVASLTTAVADIRKDVSAHEATLAKLADERTRAATAVTLDEWIAEWERAAALFDVGCKAVEAISALTSPTVPEAAGTQHFSKDARGNCRLRFR